MSFTDIPFLLAEKTTSSNSIIGETNKQVSTLKRYFLTIDWDGLVTALIKKTIMLAVTVVLFLLIYKIGRRVIKRGFDKYRLKEAYSESRIKTLHVLTNNVFFYTICFFFLYTFLTILGVPVGSLLAGAGIVGLAIGLGAQGFINDIVTGFFIILEKQLDVGDYVILSNIEGNVLAVGLRTTQVKSLDGTIHFIPNRNITIVSNKSRSNMQALVDIRINPDSDLTKVQAIIEKVNTQLVPETPEIKSGPNIWGLVDLGNGNLVFRVIFYTLNGVQAQVQRKFLQAYLSALNEQGIELPKSPITLNTIA